MEPTFTFNYNALASDAGSHGLLISFDFSGEGNVLNVQSKKSHIMLAKACEILGAKLASCDLTLLAKVSSRRVSLTTLSTFWTYGARDMVWSVFSALAVSSLSGLQTHPRSFP